MEDLQIIIDELIKKHGVEAVKAAVSANNPPKCPTGYYWNGTECVLNVG